MSKPMTFDYCASCGGSLDTGWECNDCERDWMPWAYPWWRQALDRVKAFFSRRSRESADAE